MRVIAAHRIIQRTAIIFLSCMALYACSSSTLKNTKADAANTSVKLATVTFGQLKLRLPISMLQSVTVLPLGFSNLTIHSQTGDAEIHIGTLDNFQENMAQYVSKGILDESVKTFDGFFSELVNLVGTQNYPKLQKVMEINTATNAKKYARENPSLYRFDFAKEKHVYIVFSNPKYVTEIYYLKGAISDADFDAISAGIRNR